MPPSRKQAAAAWCSLVALVLANGPLAERYADLLHAHVTIGIGGWGLDHSLHHWINDGLSRCLGLGGRTHVSATTYFRVRQVGMLPG
jgi:hypothetical protein